MAGAMRYHSLKLDPSRGHELWLGATGWGMVVYTQLMLGGMALALVALATMPALSVVLQARREPQRVALAAGPADPWLAGYINQPASDYRMPDAEGFSSTYPFRDPPSQGNHFGNALHAVRGRQLALAGPARAARATSMPKLRGFKGYVHPQQLRCIGAGCEEDVDGILKTAQGIAPKFPWGKQKGKQKGKVVLKPPSSKVVAEVKDAMEAYQKDVDLEKKLYKGSLTNAFAGQRTQSLEQQRTQSLDAGYEEDMADELNVASKVDHETVMADLPDFPASDTIDEAWKAMKDKEMNARETDKKQRGSASVS